MIFVDTGAWFASIVPSDTDYQTASTWIAENPQPLLTTDLVVDETLTLLRSRGETMRAVRLGQAFFDGTIANLYFMTEADVRQTWQVFQQFSDKGWSFTDCRSRVVMIKLGLTHAFTFDHHFRQFGFVDTVP
jgi:uncharacterized protein